MQDDESHFPKERARGLGPWVFLLPVLALVLGVLWAREETRQKTRRVLPAPPLVEAGSVAGWFASSGSNGQRVEWRLTPLHGAPGRQQFDTLALRRRLGREHGEPWQLTCRFLSEPALVSSAATASGTELGQLRIEDAAGVALETLPALTREEAEGPFDPLDVLLRVESARYGPGSEATFFLWGRRPEGNAVVRALDTELEPVPLRARNLSRSELAQSLARLERVQAD